MTVLFVFNYKKNILNYRIKHIYKRYYYYGNNALMALA